MRKSKTVLKFTDAINAPSQCVEISSGATGIDCDVLEDTPEKIQTSYMAQISKLFALQLSAPTAKQQYASRQVLLQMLIL